MTQFAAMVVPLAIFGLDLARVGGWIEAGGIVVLFGLLFACGLGLPLPEDIPLTIAGFLVAKGQMHLATAGIAAWCGIIGGDLVLYHLGRKFGLEVCRLPFIGKHVTADRIRKAEVLFDRYGILVVAVGRLFAGIRGAMVIAAGAARFSRAKFIIADGLAAIVSGGLFMWLGHWVGTNFGSMDQIHEAKKKFAGAEHWILIALIVAILIGATWYWWRKRAQMPASEKVMEKAIHHIEKRSS